MTFFNSINKKGTIQALIEDLTAISYSADGSERENIEGVIQSLIAAESEAKRHGTPEARALGWASVAHENTLILADQILYNAAQRAHTCAAVGVA